MCSLALSIVIPVLNSQDSLKPLTERIVGVFQNSGRDYEIVFVDDCSADASWDVLLEIKQQYGALVKIIRLRKNAGQHSATLCGFSKACGEIIVTMDDDLQHPPEEIPRLIEPLEQGTDLVFAALDSPKHTAAKNFGSWLVKSLQRRTFHLPSDFQINSFRAVRRSVVEQACNMNTAFPHVGCMLLSQTKNYANVLVRHDPRPYGKSNYNLLRSLKLTGDLFLGFSNYPVILASVLCGTAFLGAGLFALVAFLCLVTGHAVLPILWVAAVFFLLVFNAFTLLCLLLCLLYLSRMQQRSAGWYAIRESCE